MKLHCLILVFLGLVFFPKTHSAQELKEIPSFPPERSIVQSKGISLCQLSSNGWINLSGNAPGSKNFGAVSLLYKGGVHSWKDLINLSVLNQFQHTHPETPVFWVNTTWPDSADFDKFLQRWQVLFPVWQGTHLCLDSLKNGLYLLNADGDAIAFSSNTLELEWISNAMNELKQKNGHASRGVVNTYRYANRKTPIIQTPVNIIADERGERKFISDFWGNRIWVLDEKDHFLTCIGSGRRGDLDGDFSQSSINGPTGMAFDHQANILYFADTHNGKIKAADLTTNEIRTVLETEFPVGLILENNSLLVAGINNFTIYSLSTGKENTHYLDTTGFNLPTSGFQFSGMARDQNGVVYLSDNLNGRIYQWWNGEFSPWYPDKSAKKNGSTQINPGPIDISGNHLIVGNAESEVLEIQLSGKKKFSKLGFSLPDGAFPHSISGYSEYLYFTLSDGKVIEYNTGSDSFRRIRMKNYQFASVGYHPPIMNLHEGDSLPVTIGHNSVHLEIDLPEGYTIDPNGFSYASVSGGDLLEGSDMEIIGNELTLKFEITEKSKSGELVADFHLFLQTAEGDSFYVGRSVFFPFKTVVDKGRNSRKVVISEIE